MSPPPVIFTPSRHQSKVDYKSVSQSNFSQVSHIHKVTWLRASLGLVHPVAFYLQWGFESKYYLICNVFCITYLRSWHRGTQPAPVNPVVYVYVGISRQMVKLTYLRVQVRDNAVRAGKRNMALSKSSNAYNRQNWEDAVRMLASNRWNFVLSIWCHNDWARSCDYDVCSMRHWFPIAPGQ